MNIVFGKTTLAPRKFGTGIKFFSGSILKDIDAAKLKVTRSQKLKPKPPVEGLVFGKEFTDHMLEVDWDSKNGWTDPRIVPYGPFVLDPSCSVFHYATECFDGFKAYLDAKGKIRLFRPNKNVERLNHSSHRLVLPTCNPDALLTCINELLKIEKSWIPNKHGYSLYIRPAVIGTQPALGLATSNMAKLFVILSPVGPYYPTGFKPVKLWADEVNVRAWPGGTGGNKIGANYAPTILPQAEAAQRGYQQVLWLLGDDHQITEVGSMNLFLFWINEAGEKELVTAPLDGTILPGITRDSVLSLTKQWGEFKVSERKITMADVVKANNEKRLLEAFGAGTAAIVSPIEKIHYKGKDIHIPLDPKNPQAQIGPVAKRLVDTIMGIQYGEIPHEWSVVVD